MSQDEQTLLDQVPQAGTVAYDNIRRLLISKGQRKAVTTIHELRRKKLVYTWIDGNGILLISRQPKP